MAVELPAVVGAAASAVDAAEEHREDAVHRGEEGSAGAGLAVDGEHREDAALEVEAVAAVVVHSGLYMRMCDVVRVSSLFFCVFPSINILWVVWYCTEMKRYGRATRGIHRLNASGL